MGQNICQLYHFQGVSTLSKRPDYFTFSDVANFREQRNVVAVEDDYRGLARNSCRFVIKVLGYTTLNMGFNSWYTFL